MLHSICQQIWKTQQWPQHRKRSVFIPVPKKGNAKECSNYHTIALISDASKVMLKILQTRLEQHVNQELPDVQAGFRKGRGTRDQIASIRQIIEKSREFQKKYTSALLTMPKPLTVWIKTNWKILKEMVIPDHLTCLLRNLYAGQKASYNQTWNNGLVKNWERSTPKLYIITMLILTSMQGTSWEMLGWKNQKLESRFLGEISITSDMQMTPL